MNVIVNSAPDLLAALKESEQIRQNLLAKARRMAYALWLAEGSAEVQKLPDTYREISSALRAFAPSGYEPPLLEHYPSKTQAAIAKAEGRKKEW